MKKIKSFFIYIKYFFLSKYGFGIIFLTFVVWIIFFDENSKLKQFNIYNQNKELKKEIEDDKKNILENQMQIDLLSTDIDFIKKYAREKYQMKAENEDVFLFDE
jgi:cell division protein FtsB